MKKCHANGMDYKMKKYSDADIEAFVADTESERIERKRTLNRDTSAKIREAICAFANDLPNNNSEGFLLVGIEDDGTSSNIEITDQLLRNLADMKTDGRILPLPAMSVEKRRINGHDAAVVTVSPSDMPPVRCDGRIWVRTGSRRSIASEQDERILNERRRYKNTSFDLTAVHDSKLSDLSRAVFEEEYLPSAFAPDILEQNGRSYEERLASCKMIVSPENTTPTVLGILTLGKDPQRFIPCSYVQFLGFAGTTIGDPVIDGTKITGRIKRVIDEAQMHISAFNRTAYEVEGAPKHRVFSDYSLDAVYQVLYNAIMHRTYENTNAPVQVFCFDDRIEIKSPGGVYGRVTPENFGNPGIVDYRNPNISDVMRVLGYVQQFGRGIYLARQECERKSLPLPRFTVSSSDVACIFYSAKHHK